MPYKLEFVSMLFFMKNIDKKVKPETVKQDEDWFFIDKKFGY